MRDGWKRVKIGDLGQVITGNTPPKKDPLNYGSEYPFIKPTDMDIDRRYVTTWDENYSEKAFKKYKNSYIPPKATGVVTIGTVGEKIFQADRYCFTNQSVNVVIPNDDYDEDFVYYVLKINLPKVLNANPGTASGRHHVSKSNFCAIKIDVPKSKETQRQIASILSAYDDLIENNLKRIKLLEEQAQQTYEEWFVRMKFPGYETANFDTESGLPVGWEKLELGSLINLQSKMINPKSLNKNTPYIGLEHIPRKSITLSNWETVEKVNSSKYRFKKGDILFGKIRPYFHKVGVALIDGVASSDTIILRPKKNNLHGLILQTVYSNHFVDSATQSSNGTKMPRANWEVLQKYPVIIPKDNLIQEYNKIGAYILELISTYVSQNQRLQEARDILLPRLMTGMIDSSTCLGQGVS
ncbi:restriction endonuclease subunit S [Kordia sp.]|uniref:restriction endonuclease subunit S n=1 Tax=Kordia sp. TaxID=1965332 RepID=UPI003B594CF3